MSYPLPLRLLYIKPSWNPTTLINNLYTFLSLQILQIIAVDLDTGNNAKISYKMAEAKTEDGQLDTESFGVSPNSGWIFLKKQLDRERTSAYTLRISATDNGAPRNTATATVHISVSDYNDNDPQFSSEIYEFSVEENKPHGTVFGTLKAVDKDIDNNAAIRYSLIPSNSSFQINSFTGESNLVVYDFYVC